jgi:hypothetical protein
LSKLKYEIGEKVRFYHSSEQDMVEGLIIGYRLSKDKQTHILVHYPTLRHGLIVSKSTGVQNNGSASYVFASNDILLPIMNYHSWWLDISLNDIYLVSPPTQISTLKHCKKCNSPNEYAESNQPDGSFVCYSCRN